MKLEPTEGQIPFAIVDVFTSEPYGGNQLAVFLDLHDACIPPVMQQIARELNFAEVAFVKRQITETAYQVRIFTPEYEVPFAGHPILGTAFVLNRYLIGRQTDNILLQVPEGAIRVTFDMVQDGSTHILTMSQPQPRFGDIISAKELADELNIPLADLDSSLPIQQISTGLPYLIIPLLSRQAMESLSLSADRCIQFLTSRQMHKSNCQTGLSTSFFFVCPEPYQPASSYAARMFCLEHETIIEDAATGSANGCFLAYLLNHIQREVSIVVEQGMQMNRPSSLRLRGSVKDNHYIINVGGQVVPVAQGTWFL